MEYTLRPDELSNRYYGMRHGQSMANVQSLIISTPENGLRKDYALSDYGRQQAKDAAERSGFDTSLIIYTSDFSRARETAEILQQFTSAGELFVTAALRERSFGDWEKTHHSNYEKVWREDNDTDGKPSGGVESVHDVLARVSKLIVEIEAAYQNRDIVLVSHGDTLQIVRTAFIRQNPARHREQTPWETAAIMRL